MPSSSRKRPKKLSRRRLLKLGGTLAAVGLVGIAIGGTSALLPRGADDTDARTQSSEEGSTPGITVSQTKTTSSSSSSSLSTTMLPPVQTLTRTLPPVVTPSQPARSAAPFSIFWITDTQFLSETNPAVYGKMTQWIVDNWAAENGKMVIHTGDLVQNGPMKAEWQNADAAMSVLLDHDIPYSWCAGNHDDAVGSDSTSGWIGNQWDSFNPLVAGRRINKIQATSWVSDYHDGMNTAVGFSANGLDFLVINIEWNAGPDALDWVRGLLDDPVFMHHRVIVAPHAYIDSSGSVDDPRWGAELSAFLTKLTEVMDAHSSAVFLTLNGHFATDRGYNTPAPVNGRNELMFDRQDSTDDPDNPMASSTTDDVKRLGGGTVTILTFDTDENMIGVRTYDTYTGEYRVDSAEQYRFAMFPTVAGATPSADGAAPVTTGADPFVFPTPQLTK